MKKKQNIPLSKVYIDNRIKKTVCRVLDSGSYILGKECKSFEEEFAQFIGTRYGILVSSGTAAIWLTLIALGVKPKNEVIVPALTAFPTVEPILAVGAKPVFVDIDDTYTIDTKKIKAAISKKTVGIIPVHLYGHPANMGEVLQIAKAHNLFVLEDCCQAHGAKFNGKLVGSIGIAGCFSFYPSKNLTVCGDGGVIVSDNPAINKKVRMLRNHGRVSKYIHSILGYNERFNEVQAAIGRLGLKKLVTFNSRRREIADIYIKNLKDLPIILPKPQTWSYHVYHMFVIRTRERNNLKERLLKKGIEAGIHYPAPCHLQPPILDIQGRKKMPLAEKYCKEILSLPIHPALKDNDVRYVCQIIREAVSS